MIPEQAIQIGHIDPSISIVARYGFSHPILR